MPVMPTAGHFLQNRLSLQTVTQIHMRYLFVLAILTLWTSCATVKVSYDYDKQSNFSNYKTYAFTDEAMKLPVDDLNRARILQAVETEMKAKGFTKTPNSDVLIDLILKAEQKTEATATNTGGYGYGRYGYGGGFSSTRIDYDTYVVGTLFISMVDKTTEKIVWSGRGTKTLDETASPEKREANINYAVKLIFTQYPPKKK